MESWVVGFDGDDDVERHADMPDAAIHEKPRLRVRVVSDYICPWCFIGERRFERLDEDFDVEWDICAYDLKPGLPAEGMARSDVYAGRVYPPGYLDRMYELANADGIKMKRPAWVPNTRIAHEATEFARDHGALMPFHSAVYSAYWERERNISLPDVLAEIATECGLDSEGLREALADRRYRDRIDGQFEWARLANITAVPAVIVESRFAVVGAQDYDVYRDVAQRLLNRKSEDASGQA